MAIRKKAAPKRAAKPARAIGADPTREAEALLYAQAEILDGKRWQDYIDLFAEDGVYWCPADPAHTHWDGVPSIFCEDRDMMAVRMNRILHPRAWSQKTQWGTSHVVGNVRVLKSDAKGMTVRSRFHMIEYRNDGMRHAGGAYTHELVRVRGGALKIRTQRVDLVHWDAPYEYVYQAWI